MTQKEQMEMTRKMLETAYDHQDMAAISRLSQLLDHYADQQARAQLTELSKPA